ncbi:MAG: triacylglycerol lipase [Deltaproteobacteria bacterium]|nr:MAG: triacylglycerol lipase [Deltaproteobacteria bacterium]
MRTNRLDLVLVVVALGASPACDDGADAGDPETATPTKAEAAERTDTGKADWSLDVCQSRGWYGDGACDWFCPKADPDCALPPLGAEPEGFPTRYPIVLHHGFNASTTNSWAFNGVKEVLEADGHTVALGSAPPYDSPMVRAGYLAAIVDDVIDRTGADKVNLVCHSMGGLDCRYLVAGLGYGDQVASITTLSTPHRGTRIADVALSLVPGAFEDAIDQLASLWGMTFSDLAADSHVLDALYWLSEAHAPELNDAYPDDPGVYYQSWAGVSSVFGIPNPKDAAACRGLDQRHPGTVDKMDARLAGGAAVVAHGVQLLPNDGMATVESALWGEFRGCVPADHLDEVGQVGDVGPDPHTGFDHLRWYRNIAYDLAARGF